MKEYDRDKWKKKIAAVKRRFNRKKYLQLLTGAMPRIIETREELDRVNKLIEPFLHPERELPPEDRRGLH